ncbi:MAG TPA: LLM class flavin-dependent oxidoreductase, partial [Chloroflexi bacterium]|nr:LLM class flavin-dependent oxidoreductase [Chloroflexota bacterium]
ARQELALYLGVVLALDRTGPLDPEEATRVRAALARGDGVAAAEVLSDESLRRFALAGTPQEVVRQVIDLFDAGAGRVEFGTPHGLSELEGIRLLGERVLPALRD